MKKDFLKGKRILFIGIGFYDYDEAIKIKLQKKGAIVEYTKIVHNKILKKMYHKNMFNLKNYIFNLMNNVFVSNYSKRDDFDYVFVIKGEYLSDESLRSIKKLNPDATFILYQWDSIERVDNFNSISSNFDKIFSFDRIDCIKNKSLNFLPLFYRDNSILHNIDKTIDLSFVGWLHADRFDLLKKIEQKCITNGINTYIHLLTGLKTYVKLLLNNDSSYVKKIISLDKLSYKKYLEIISHSRVVIDINHPNQTGLTMRTVELLANNIKIITTNEDIKNYSFYDSRSISIINRNGDNLDLDFIYDKTFSELDMSGYSLDNWLNTLFTIK